MYNEADLEKTGGVGLSQWKWSDSSETGFLYTWNWDNWDPEYGCSLAWDDSINAWVTSRDKNLDYFNIACQAMANMYKVNILTIYKWYYEIRPLFIDQENERFQLPSTKEVIEYLFKKDE